MAKKKTKGLFIVFEGPDRTGKSTQSALLIKKLSELGREVVHTREPGGTPCAEAIRRMVLDPAYKVLPMAELLLYEASRAQHTGEKILPALQAGKVVLCERYAMSSVAYQCGGRGLSEKTVNTLNEIATGGLHPDLTIVFSMPDSNFTTRGRHLKADRLEMEGGDFRSRVRKAYARLARTTRGAVLLNADRSVEEVEADIWKLVSRRLGAKRRG